ncbi:MAG: DUF1801 domain-containing protein [Micrococcales bacterium]|nr:DUF1801 domain-containing protein [Micrococcales bacterium]
MPTAAPAPSAVDAYIAGFEPAVRAKLEQMRQLVRRAAPGASERISYNMPAYFGRGVLVYFGAFKGHISLFPTGEGVAAFGGELAALGLKTSKGTIQLPLDQPLPKDLIKRIVQHRVQVDQAQAARNS